MKELIGAQKKTAADLGITEVKETARKNYGATKPGAGLWPNNVPFFDQTNKMWVYWDGARWLTAHTEVMRFPRTAYSANTTDVSVMQVLPSDFAVELVRMEMYTTLGATNNATNFWFYQLQRTSADITGAVSTALGTAGGDYQLGADLTTVLTVGGYLNIRVAKGGTGGAPSNLNVAGMVRYRLVIP